MTLHIHCDGSCFHLDGRMGMGVALFEDDAEKPSHVIRLSGEYLGTSNEAEYLAIRRALTHLRKIQHPDINVIIYSDSQLVINQINRKFRVNDLKLYHHFNQVTLMLYDITVPIQFIWVPRTNPRQKIVDKLSKQANPYFQNRKLIKIRE